MKWPGHDWMLQRAALVLLALLLFARASGASLELHEAVCDQGHSSEQTCLALLLVKQQAEPADDTQVRCLPAGRFAFFLPSSCLFVAPLPGDQNQVRGPPEVQV